MMEIGEPEFVRRIAASLRDADQPDFSIVWFLGAGASVSSGIPSAGGLVREWLPALQRLREGHEEDTESWASAALGYDPANPARSYATVMSQLFPTARERQQEIERRTSEKEPSIGYALLAALMTHPTYGARANVVVTTNFDDLVADAVYLTTRKKPLVVGHDYLSEYVRRAISRPLVVKVHGDARLSPRNTPDEITALNKDFAAQIQPLFANCALVIMGYGGNDQSIADLFASASSTSFPLGVYWVGRSRPKGVVGDWFTGRAESFWVPSPDFDDIFLQLRDEMKIELETGTRWSELFASYAETLQRTSTTSIDAAAVDRALRAKESIDAVLLVDSALRLERENPDEAARQYEEALRKDPDNAAVLSAYASFLTRVRQEHDRAQELYERALAADPRRLEALGNYANFLTDVRKDHDRTQELYERALSLAPDRADTLGNYANFLTEVRQDQDRAQETYERALAAEPDHANNLGNYANFLKRVRHDDDRAQETYERALAVDPDHANTLGNYALFLKQVREDFDRAETLYRRAAAMDGVPVYHLSNYGFFLHSVRRDYAGAREFYGRAVSLGQTDAAILGNYAQLLAVSSQEGERRRGAEIIGTLLEDADAPKELRLEVCVYAAVHVPERRSRAFVLAKTLLRDGDRSTGWSFDPTLGELAADDPDAALIRLLAAAVAEEADAADLDAFPAWASAVPEPA